VPFGLFVRIPTLGIDGLVHVSALPRDYYHREPSGTALVGERTGQRYSLMEPVRVRLSNVNLEERKIDFALEAGDEDSRRLRHADRPREERKRGAGRGRGRGRHGR
jgi:ribonuclease R